MPAMRKVAAGSASGGSRTPVVMAFTSARHEGCDHAGMAASSAALACARMRCANDSPAPCSATTPARRATDSDPSPSGARAPGLAAGGAGRCQPVTRTREPRGGSGPSSCTRTRTTARTGTRVPSERHTASTASSKPALAVAW